MSQIEKASRLLHLHHSDVPLVLINAWDAASARLVEQSGFPAVATTSAGVANALGYPDGQYIPWTEMVEAISRISEAVRVPVTADIEAGFAADAEKLEAALEQVVEAGAVGINLEDALPGAAHGPLYSLEEQVARIQSVRKITDKLKVHLVINARTDAFWERGAEPAQALKNTLERGRAYLAAGADCIFVPGLRDPEKIAALVAEWKAPINILAGAGVPSIPELAKLGVKRISFGSGPMRAAMGVLRRITDQAKSTGTYSAMVEGAMTYDEMQELMKR
ncbi:MAG TPA: isocitrate lyase/phosphoenolpyruvate mutase family protein [Terriglobales bacterium]|nr:isocitrate lyase/phosphoenolpyruvate mutase family protein [Terriglobales bacterium]